MALARSPSRMTAVKSASVGGRDIGVDLYLQAPRRRSRGFVIMLLAAGPSPSPFSPWHIEQWRT
jgi:hypothetical protein